MFVGKKKMMHAWLIPEEIRLEMASVMLDHVVLNGVSPCRFRTEHKLEMFGRVPGVVCKCTVVLWPNNREKHLRFSAGSKKTVCVSADWPSVRSSGSRSAGF
jgi:hypothetical protein